MSTILVVDDSAYARRTMRKTLETAHYNVVDAGGGMAAIESYFLEHPQLVLLDLTMEDMDGLQVLKKLCELDAAVRVIVVSADVQTSTEAIVREAGGVAFPEPVVSETLLRTIDTVMQGAS